MSLFSQTCLKRPRPKCQTVVVNYRRWVLMRVRFTKKTDFYIACVASVSMRFRSKERGSRVCKDRAKNWVTFIFWFFFHFSRGQNRESRSLVFLCSETKRKRLLRRLTFIRNSTSLKKQTLKLNRHALLMW